MQTDEEVGKVAQAVPVIISRTLELFIESLLTKSVRVCSVRNAKTLSTSHIKQVWFFLTSVKRQPSSWDFFRSLSPSRDSTFCVNWLKMYPTSRQWRNARTKKTPPQMDWWINTIKIFINFLNKSFSKHLNRKRQEDSVYKSLRDLSRDRFTMSRSKCGLQFSSTQDVELLVNSVKLSIGSFWKLANISSITFCSTSNFRSSDNVDSLWWFCCCWFCNMVS